ncbi:hypothetical protein ZHAS_00019881 [Anopheles sinensis]|uniref:Uncharacterized protein n=1 Tax=Anopheles sinensis TaxID=74873 RepID=A0A084WMG1_ANOSI|nr:hypothetical protein ZHAS_00019881 [Anopheles sinensis]
MALFGAPSSSGLMAILLMGLLQLHGCSGDYENTWNFYYEQPCCGSGQSNGGVGFNGQHHIRHHKALVASEALALALPSLGEVKF